MLDKINFKFFIPFFLLILQCQNSQSTSFFQLTNAFFDWFYKSNPVEGSSNGIHLYDFSYPSLTKNSIERNLDDINRFLIEMDQIDYRELSIEEKNNYFVLFNEMERLQFNYKEFFLFDRSPFFYLEKIHKGILSIEYDDKESFENYISRLKQIFNIIESAKKNIKNRYYSKLNNDMVENIFFTLNQKYKYFSNKNILLDTLDYYNNNAQKKIRDFENWINKECINDTFNIIEPEVFSENMSYYINNSYKYNKEQALRDLNRLYSKMVKLSLPIFLLENDEPIWINKKDSLEVIQFALLNKQDDLDVNFSDYLKAKIPIIKKQIKNNHIFKINSFINNKIVLKNNFFHDYKILSINYPGSFDRDQSLTVHTNELSKDWSLEKQNYFYKKYTKINYDLIIIESFLSGEYLFNLYSSSNSIINKTIKNKVFTEGWKKYIQEIVIDNIKDYDQNYKLFQYQQLIKSIINYIVDFELNTGLISKKEAINFMVDNGFYFRYEATYVIDEMLASPGIFSLEYIGYKEIKEIEKDYKKKNGKKFNLKVFNMELILNSKMNFKDIKNTLIN